MEPVSINVFNGARQFMHRWDFFAGREAPSALGTLRIATKTSSAGNSNMGGTELFAPSVIFVASQEGFLLAIEPGIRDLVKVLALERNLITYSSCEGHRYSNGRSPDVRCVGILPRHERESGIVAAQLKAVADRWNAAGQDPAITALFLQRQLTDGSVKLPALDLVLTRSAEHTWDQYFAGLDACTKVFVSWLSEPQSA